MAWQRVDGKPFSDSQLQADRAFCQGEVTKADLSNTARARGDYEFALGHDGKLQNVMIGCMGGRGYILVAAD